MSLLSTVTITDLNITTEAAQAIYNNSGGSGPVSVFLQGLLTGLTAGNEYLIAVRLSDGTNNNDSHRVAVTTEIGQTRLFFSTGAFRLGNTAAPGIGHTLSLLLTGVAGDTAIDGTVQVLSVDDDEILERVRSTSQRTQTDSP
jgi:hypothetical protein